MALPKKGEYWRHYKTDGSLTSYTYEIMGFGLAKNNSEDMPEAPVIIYRPLYEADILIEHGLNFFVRPVSLFTDEVEIDGTMRPRFIQVTDEKEIEQLKKL